MNKEYDQLFQHQLELICEFLREDYGNDLGYESFAEYLLLMLEDIPMGVSITAPDEVALVEQGYRLYIQLASSGEPPHDAG